VNVPAELLDASEPVELLGVPWPWPGTVAAAITENTATMPAAHRKQAHVRSCSFRIARSRCSIASIGSNATGLKVAGKSWNRLGKGPVPNSGLPPLHSINGPCPDQDAAAR